MFRFDKTKVVLGWVLLVLVGLSGRALSAAAQEEVDPLVQMILELLGDANRDMRALGMQQVREEVPGEAVTKKFAEVLPTLPIDGQVGLLEALGDREDKAALPVVLDMLAAKEEPVRVAAIGALGMLGSAADVPKLVEKTVTGSNAESTAGRNSLIRLRGEDVNSAIVDAMSKGEPNVQVKLLDVLAARNAVEALPSVLEGTKSSESSVRVAALGALRLLASPADTEAIVNILKSTTDPTERGKAELTLLAVCGEEGVDALVAGLAEADAPTRVVLLRALARAGGAKALDAVSTRRDDDDETVRDETIRMLSGWATPDAGNLLLETAKASDNQRHRVLAMRGLVRLASAAGEKPADVTMLADVMQLAKRPEEQRLVLGAVSSTATPEALNLAASACDNPAVAEEAALAVVVIAEKIQDGDKDKLKAALEKASQTAKDPTIRERAQKVLKTL